MSDTWLSPDHPHESDTWLSPDHSNVEPPAEEKLARKSPYKHDDEDIISVSKATPIIYDEDDGDIGLPDHRNRRN